MAHLHHRDGVVSQETNFDNADQAGIAQPYSQSEIDDLLYGDGSPVEDRLARLREIRDEAAIRESGDFGDEDPASMLSALDRAIEELSGDSAASDDNLELADVVVDDPADHSHTLSPDDVEALEELSGLSEEDELDDDNGEEDSAIR